jgi:cytochrome c biogenesis protein CcmG/thiol:disulfide interchange protein DsbE
MKRLATALLISALLVPAAASAAPLYGGAGAQTMATAAGSSISLDELHGKPVYLSFFATWCGPCNEEAPALEAVAKKYQRSGLTVVGIDEQESQARAQAFASKYGLTYPIALDSNGALGDELGVEATPTNIFIDRDGNVSSVHVGEMSPAAMDAAVKRIL